MKLYVIIVTYNGAIWIDNCLRSLINSNISLSLIVIDNNSTDNTINKIEEYYKKVEVLKQNKNLGFGKANNIGIKYALNRGADYIFLLNQDAWVETDTLSKLVDIADRSPDYGIISPVHINGNNTGLDINFSNFVNPNNCPGFYSDLYMETRKDLYETKFVNAGAWLISRSCINRVGLFEPLFFLYGEDDNYIQRVYYHGYKVGIAPNAKIYHDRDERITTGNNQKHLHKTNLVTLLNVNNNIIKSYCKFFEYNFINSIKSLFLLKPLHSLNYLAELFYFSFSVVNIYRSRSKAKKGFIKNLE